MLKSVVKSIKSFEFDLSHLSLLSAIIAKNVFFNTNEGFPVMNL